MQQFGNEISARNWSLCLRALGIMALAGIPLMAQLSVTLTPSPVSPQPVGTPVTWTAALNGGCPSGHTCDYQFTSNPSTGSTEIHRDYNLGNTYGWAPIQGEGAYTVGVNVRDRTAGTVGSASASYTLTTRLLGGVKQAVNPTVHPLVALFTGPACNSANVMLVKFTQHGGGIAPVFSTNSLACNGVTAMYFYIAGMYQNTEYDMHWETYTASGVPVNTNTKILNFTTGSIGAVVLPTVAPDPSTPTPPAGDVDPVVLHGFIPVGAAFVPAATDLIGNYTWYMLTPVAFFDRGEGGGSVFISQTFNPAPYAEVLREVDLVGNVLHETNAEIVSEQLTAAGKQPVTSFHHEIRRLPTGNIVAIASDEAIITNSTQCAPNPSCDVLGDQIVVLSPNLQLVWSWDALTQSGYTDHFTGVPGSILDRQAPLNDTCTPNQQGCPPVLLANIANDWLHSNSLQLTTDDGNFVLSMRSQDWTVKIDYNNGVGDGHIMWRIGPAGDFGASDSSRLPTTTNVRGNDSTNSSDDGQYQITYPWFSHQHEPQFTSGATLPGNQLFTVFDDGNTRHQIFGGVGNSRGQVYGVNQTAFTANLNFNADLNAYSGALGTAQILPNGNRWFDNGFINGFAPGGYTHNTETDKNGNIIYLLDATTTISGARLITYRSFRLPDLYTATP